MPVEPLEPERVVSDRREARDDILGVVRDGDLAAFDMFQHDQWNFYRYPDPMDKPSGVTEHLRWLEEAGFIDVDVYWLKAGHAIYGGRKAG